MEGLLPSVNLTEVGVFHVSGLVIKPVLIYFIGLLDGLLSLILHGVTGSRPF